MYINTASYSSRIDEVCMHKTLSDGTSQQVLAVHFRLDRAQTTITCISFYYYHELKLVCLKQEGKGVLYQEQTYSLFTLRRQ